MWFDRASAARFQKRKNQTDKAQKIFVPEDDDFEWICTYTTDYLELEHAGLAQQDIVALIESALHICTKSGAFIDFDRLLRILKTVCSRYGCPQCVLEKSLFILCGIRGSFRELPSQLDECTDLILLGSDSLPAIQILHSFMRTDISNLDLAKSSIATNAARGVVQVFRQNLESKTAWAVSTENLLTSLSSAVSMQSGRVNEVILPLCVTMIEREPFIAHGSDEEFLKFMEIVNTAYVAVKIPNQAAEEKPAGSVRLSKDSKATEIGLLNVRDHVDDALSKLLRSLNGFKQSLVFKRFMEFAELQSPRTSLQILDFAAEQLSKWQEQKPLDEYCLPIIRSFIQNAAISSELRLAGLRVIQTFLWPSRASWPYHPDGRLNSSEVVKTTDLARELFKDIPTEIDLSVLKALIDMAVRAAFTCNNESFIEQVCADLEKVVLGGRSSSSPQVRRKSEIGAQGLVSIFMQSLPTHHVDLTEFVFGKLNHIASSFSVPPEARLAAMRLLVRIRCDSAGRIYVSQASDSEYLAAALCRTDETAAKFPWTAESSDDRRGSRSSGAASRRPKPTPTAMDISRSSRFTACSSASTKRIRCRPWI